MIAPVIPAAPPAPATSSTPSSDDHGAAFGDLLHSATTESDARAPIADQNRSRRDERSPAAARRDERRATATDTDRARANGDAARPSNVSESRRSDATTRRTSHGDGTDAATSDINDDDATSSSSATEATSGAVEAMAEDEASIATTDDADPTDEVALEAAHAAAAAALAAATAAADATPAVGTAGDAGDVVVEPVVDASLGTHTIAVDDADADATIVEVPDGATPTEAATTAAVEHVDIELVDGDPSTDPATIPPPVEADTTSEADEPDVAATTDEPRDAAPVPIDADTEIDLTDSGSTPRDAEHFDQPGAATAAVASERGTDSMAEAAPDAAPVESVAAPASPAPAPTATAAPTSTAVAAPVVAQAAPSTPVSLAGAPLPPEIAPEVHEQVINRVSALRELGDGAHELILELDPVELGHLRLEVVMRDGAVNLRIQADDPNTRALLNQTIADLRSALDDAGLQTGFLDVSDQDTRGGSGEERPDRTATAAAPTPSRRSADIVLPDRVDVLL